MADPLADFRGSEQGTPTLHFPAQTLRNLEIGSAFPCSDPQKSASGSAILKPKILRNLRIHLFNCLVLKVNSINS